MRETYFFNAMGLSKQFAIAIFVFCFALTVRLLNLVYVDFVFDDAYIVWRIARNFANGHGLVFNIGEYTQTSTSAIYALTIGAFWPLLGDLTPGFFRFLGVIADSGVALLLSLMMDRQGKYGTQLGVISGLLYAVFPIPVFVAGAGLETPFYCLFIAVAFYCLMIGRNLLSVSAGALVAIIRPDGLLCFVVIIGDLFFNNATNRNRLHIFRILVVPSLVVGFYYFSIFSYYGSIVPQTISAKSLYVVDHVQVWHDFLSKYFFGGKRVVLGLLFFLGVIGMFINKHNDLRPLLIWGSGYAVAFSSMGLWWTWYLPPFIMVYSIMLSLGVVVLSDFFWWRNKFNFILLLIFGLLAGMFAYKSVQNFNDNKGTRMKYERQRRDIAEYLNQRLPNEGIVSLEPLGVFGYFSKHRIADYPGLASRQVTKALKSLGRPIGANPEDSDALEKLVVGISPDALILRRSEYQASITRPWVSAYHVEKVFGADPQFSAKHGDFQPMYVLVHKISVPGVESQKTRVTN